MVSNSPFPILEHEWVWLVAEGVLGEQPPKGAMLYVRDIFDVEEGSLELGPPGKYACCWYKNKFVYVSLEKLCAVHPGQWVKFELHGREYTGQIAKRGSPTLIIRMKPPYLDGTCYTIAFPGIGEFMSLVDEKEVRNGSNGIRN